MVSSHKYYPFHISGGKKNKVADWIAEKAFQGDKRQVYSERLGEQIISMSFG